MTITIPANAVAIANLATPARSGVSHIEETGAVTSYRIDQAGDLHRTGRFTSRRQAASRAFTRRYPQMLKAVGW